MRTRLGIAGSDDRRYPQGWRDRCLALGSPGTTRHMTILARLLAVPSMIAIAAVAVACGGGGASPEEGMAR